MTTRFYEQDLDETNVRDLRRSIDTGDLVAVVDLAAGGIVAYVVASAVADIVNPLNDWAGPFDEGES